MKKRAFVSILCILLAACLLTGCGISAAEAPATPEETPAATELPATPEPSPEPAPTEEPEPAPTEEPEPLITQENYLGTWICEPEDYLRIGEEGAELYLGAQRRIIVCQPRFLEESGQLLCEGEDFSLTLLWEKDPAGAFLSAPGEEEGTTRVFRPGQDEDPDRILRKTGYVFVGDWDLLTVTGIETGAVVNIRSDGTCYLYKRDYTWVPGVEGKEDYDGISLYRYGKLVYVLIGSETPLGDRAFLSEVDGEYLRSSALLIRRTE